MASKLQLVAEFGRQKTVELSSVRGHWQQYLKTASRIYKYPFWDQLLIHAQRPDATACASMDIWNRRMGRWINRGANGIALIDNNSPTPKVRYVFDISDTHPASGAEQIAIPGFWLMSPAHEVAVLEHLSNSYGPPSYGAAPFVEQVQEICASVTDDNFGGYLEQLRQAKQDSFLEELDELNLHIRFRDLVSNSVAYAVLTRCGYDADRLYSPDDFAAIHDFSTYEVMTILGDVTSTLSKMMLMGIGRAITSLERDAKFAKTPDMVYDEHEKNTPPIERKELEHHGRIDIHEDRGLLLSGSGSPARGGERPAPGQVRDAAHDLAEGTRSDPVRHDVAGRRIVPISAGDRPAGPRDGGSDRPADGGSRGRERGDEGQRSDALGGPDEQLQGIGGGNRPAPVGLRMTDPEPGDTQLGFFEQLDTFPQAEYVEPTSSAFFIDQNSIDHILRLGGNTHRHRERIVATFEKQKSTAEIADILKNLYHGGNGIGSVTAWYAEDGIHLSHGKTARYDKSAQVISWESAVERIGQLLQDGQFATNVELAEAPGYERSLLAEKLWYLHHDFSEETRAAGYLPSLAKNPARGFPEETAWLAEQLDSPEFRQSLTEEYAAFQSNYRENPNLLRFHHHKLQEISDHLHDLSLPRTAFSSALTEIPSLQQFITDDEIDAAISSGSSMAGGKSRIFAFFQKNHTEKETADFLKQEYGIGGRSNALSGAGSSWESYDGKGLHYKKDGCPDVHLTWEQVAKRIAGLIQKGRYLTGEEQAEYDKIQAEKALDEVDALKAQQTPDRYEVVVYHHFMNGFDEKLDYATLEEAEQVAQGYVNGTMEEDGFQYDGAAVYDLQEQKHLRIYGDFPDEKAHAEVTAQNYLPIVDALGGEVITAPVEEAVQTGPPSPALTVPPAPLPVGRIDFLATNGSVGESVEYTDAEEFVAAIKEENYFGAPMRIPQNTQPCAVPCPGPPLWGKSQAATSAMDSLLPPAADGTQSAPLKAPLTPCPI